MKLIPRRTHTKWKSLTLHICHEWAGWQKEGSIMTRKHIQHVLRKGYCHYDGKINIWSINITWINKWHHSMENTVVLIKSHICIIILLPCRMHNGYTSFCTSVHQYNTVTPACHKNIAYNISHVSSCLLHGIIQTCTKRNGPKLE